MFRRKTRNEPAYTGVSSLPPHGTQPSSNALAAALTIGRGLKTSPQQTTTQPVRSGATSTHKPITSMSSPKPPFSSGSFSSTSSKTQPKQTLLNRRRSSVKIDQSHFNEFDGDGAPVSNYKNSPNASLGGVSQVKPKMIKRYIPTSTGVKVIEVPEESINQQISRSNSLRAGCNIRSNSLLGSHRNSFSSFSGIPRSPSLQRTSLLKQQPRNSLTSQNSMASQTRRTPKSSPLTSQSTTQSHKPTAKPPTSEEDNELDKLQAEIEKQKQIQKQIELKKLEYQQLKSQNEKSLRQLATNHEVLDTTIEEDDEADNIDVPSSFDVSKLSSDPDKVTNHSKNTHILDSPSSSYHEDSDVNEDHLNSEVPELHDTTMISDMSDLHESNFTEVDVPQKKSLQIPKVVPPSLEPIGSVEDIPQPNGLEKTPADDITQNSGSTLVPSVLVAQMDSASSNYDDADQISNSREKFSSNNHSGAEIGIINQYVDSQDHLDGTNSQNEEKSSFALRPKFDTKPEIIEVQDDEENPAYYHLLESNNRGRDHLDNLLSAPSLPGVSSSASSIGSAASSESPKKPLKSAMKNSSSIGNLNSNSNANYNPAHEAYLSLTTSENTRLNSKLSANNLNDTYLNGTATNQKRVSQTLRQHSKSPLRNSHQPQMTKSLRPQSMHTEANEKQTMSNRTLRSSVYVAPISAHPALQPGYKSPSKQKAQELYAKANSRPKSQFNQIARKSSFTKDTDTQTPHLAKNQSQAQPHSFSNGLQLQNQVQQQSRSKQPKLTLRSSSPQTMYASQNPAVPKETIVPLSNSGFKSRFDDSDDDDNFVSPKPQQISAPTNNPTLRSPEAQASATGELTIKEKKKFGKLRKLFGKNR